MKKILVVTLILVLVLAGCSNGGDVKTGLGQVISIAKSADATAEKEGLAQVDTVMAAVTVDAKGVLKSVYIDTAQTKVNFTAEGVISTDKAAEQKTKKELGDDYGMKKQSSIGREWYEQIEALEDWMEGKTIEQIKGMKTKVVNESHQNVPDEADLTSSVTVTVEDYIAAVEEAVKNAK